jgi:hypothetical protein
MAKKGENIIVESAGLEDGPRETNSRFLASKPAARNDNSRRGVGALPARCPSRLPRGSGQVRTSRRYKKGTTKRGCANDCCLRAGDVPTRNKQRFLARRKHNRGADFVSTWRFAVGRAPRRARNDDSAPEARAGKMPSLRIRGRRHRRRRRVHVQPWPART